MTEIMYNNPEIDLLTSNYTIFFSEKDNASTSYKETERKMVNDGKISKLSIDPKWAYIIRPGCTFCFRKRFYNEIKEEWNTYYPHDAILWRLARAKGTMAILLESLVDFRRHGDNATSVKIRTKSERIQTFEDYIWFHNAALKYPLSKYDKHVIEKGIKFLKLRKKMYTTRNPLILFVLFIKYNKYYLTVKGLLGDAYFLIKDKEIR